MALGEGDYRYELAEGWAKLPEGWVFSLVSDVAVDSRGRIYAFTRGKHPLIVFDKEGNFLTSWGYGECGISPHLVSQSHGIFIDPDDKVYLTDAVQHIVRRYTRLGEMEREWGTLGCLLRRSTSRSTICRQGLRLRPMDRSTFRTDTAIAARTSIRRRGSACLRGARGGSGPGQFAVVHNIGCDKTGRVLVCDRENNRVQIFDSDGKYIEEWTDVIAPGDVWVTDDNTIYIVEQGGSGRVDAGWGANQPVRRLGGRRDAGAARDLRGRRRKHLCS